MKQRNSAGAAGEGSNAALARSRFGAGPVPPCSRRTASCGRQRNALHTTIGQAGKYASSLSHIIHACAPTHAALNARKSSSLPYGTAGPCGCPREPPPSPLLLALSPEPHPGKLAEFGETPPPPQPSPHPPTASAAPRLQTRATMPLPFALPAGCAEASGEDPAG